MSCPRGSTEAARPSSGGRAPPASRCRGGRSAPRGRCRRRRRRRPRMSDRGSWSLSPRARRRSSKSTNRPPRRIGGRRTSRGRSSPSLRRGRISACLKPVSFTRSDRKRAARGRADSVGSVAISRSSLVSGLSVIVMWFSRPLSATSLRLFASPPIVLLALLDSQRQTQTTTQTIGPAVDMTGRARATKITRVCPTNSVRSSRAKAPARPWDLVKDLLLCRGYRSCLVLGSIWDIRDGQASCRPRSSSSRSRGSNGSALRMGLPFRANHADRERS
jgi:hypothetical protein